MVKKEKIKTGQADSSFITTELHLQQETYITESSMQV